MLKNGAHIQVLGHRQFLQAIQATRRKYHTRHIMNLFTEFTNPIAELTITVSCQTTNADSLLNSYTARLIIHRTGIRMK